MTRVYYREAMGAFIVFDVTRPASFEAVTKWKEDLDSKLTLANGKHVATVLLANKCDQGRDVLTNNGIKMEQFCQENGFVGWFETSAKVRNAHTHEYKAVAQLAGWWCCEYKEQPPTGARRFKPLCRSACPSWSNVLEKQLTPYQLECISPST